MNEAASRIWRTNNPVTLVDPSGHDPWYYEAEQASTLVISQTLMDMWSLPSITNSGPVLGVSGVSTNLSYGTDVTSFGGPQIGGVDPSSISNAVAANSPWSPTLSGGGLQSGGSTDVQWSVMLTQMQATPPTSTSPVAANVNAVLSDTNSGTTFGLANTSQNLVTSSGEGIPGPMLLEPIEWPLIRAAAIIGPIVLGGIQIYAGGVTAIAGFSSIPTTGPAGAIVGGAGLAVGAGGALQVYSGFRLIPVLFPSLTPGPNVNPDFSFIPHPAP